jgi:hypothetical protein
MVRQWSETNSGGLRVFDILDILDEATTNMQSHTPKVDMDALMSVLK